MTDPGNLTADDAADLNEIRTSCPELDAATHHVRAFATMMGDLRGDQLPAWMKRVIADDLLALHSLINGLSRDIDAVTTGLPNCVTPKPHQVGKDLIVDTAGRPCSPRTGSHRRCGTSTPSRSGPTRPSTGVPPDPVNNRCHDP
ncbi:hypothetical protein ACH47Z_43195 [Streptomyces sp. NPDC020192]|uniref:hypothetical protein n=1 Tax=Streptomyces sp. NPDC020192 TaxID=3365066 RepID=UPI0037BCCE74